MTVASENKPSVLPLILDAIPAELRERAQWVSSRLEQRDGEWTKILYDPHNGRKARANALTTWASFKESVTAFGRGGYSGIGFEFSTDDPYAGVDLDKCRDRETATIGPWAQRIVELETHLGGMP